MSRIWYTSDLHIGHKKVSELRGFLDEDGAPDTGAHDATLFDTWHKTVKPDDTVFILGDIAMGNFSYALAALRNLPGTKHLVSGNHDPVHPMHTTALKKLVDPDWTSTFATIQPFVRRKLNKQTVLLSHFPYYRDHGEARYLEYRLRDTGNWLIHGHTHGTEKISFDFWKTGEKMSKEIHVGLDAWDLQLVPQEYILETIS